MAGQKRKQLLRVDAHDSAQVEVRGLIDVTIHSDEAVVRFDHELPSRDDW